MSCDICHVLSSVTRLYPAPPSQYPTHVLRAHIYHLNDQQDYVQTLNALQHHSVLLQLRLSFRLWTEQEARQVTRAERLP